MHMNAMKSQIAALSLVRWQFRDANELENWHRSCCFLTQDASFGGVKCPGAVLRCFKYVSGIQINAQI